MKRRNGLPILLTLGGALACAGSGPAAPAAPVKARVSRVFPKTKALDTSLLAVKVEVYNPRSTPVRVASIGYALDTGDLAGVIEGNVTADATLDGEQQAEMGFDIEVPLPKDSAQLENLLKEDVVPADLTGEIQLSDGTKASFERSTGLAMPRLPRFIVHDAQAAQYEGQGVEVTFLLRLLNDNAFTQAIQSVKYTVAIGRDEMRTEEGGVGTRLPAGSAEEYEVSVALEPDYAGLDALLASGVIEYRINGEIETPTLVIPFDHTGKIDLGASN